MHATRAQQIAAGKRGTKRPTKAEGSERGKDWSHRKEFAIPSQPLRGKAGICALCLTRGWPDPD
ncbi:hypothetical protein DEJ45_04590 [Streptomyces venezuelae]|nr:hypothetical protein DEJ45_04590 [Streptomyces venezuelae]